jgi:hypothetical protein
MASKVQLTPAQKRELGTINRLGSVIIFHYSSRKDAKLYQELVKKGYAASEYIRVGEYRYTLTELGASLFAEEPDPAPSDTPASSTPEAVAGETVAPVASTPVCDVCHENKSTVRMCYYNSTPVMLACTDCILDTEYEAPVADSDIPFAQGMDDSEPQGEGVFKMGDSLIGQANIWTHNFDDMPRPRATETWRNSKRDAWLFTERATVTGHGRTSRNRANKGHKGVKSQRKLSSITMERNESKQAANRAKYSQQIERRNLALLDMLSRIHVVNFPQVVNKKRAA